MYYWLCLSNHGRHSFPNTVSTVGGKGGGGFKSDLQSVARGKFKGAVGFMHPWITAKALLSGDMKIEKHVCLEDFLPGEPTLCRRSETTGPTGETKQCAHLLHTWGGHRLLVQRKPLFALRWRSVVPHLNDPCELEAGESKKKKKNPTRSKNWKPSQH